MEDFKTDLEELRYLDLKDLKVEKIRLLKKIEFIDSLIQRFDSQKKNEEKTSFIKACEEEDDEILEEFMEKFRIELELGRSVPDYFDECYLKSIMERKKKTFLTMKRFIDSYFSRFKTLTISGMKRSYASGDLEIIKEFDGYRERKVDSHFDSEFRQYDQFFKIACRHGHLDLAKEIHLKHSSLFSFIDYEIRSIFIEACKKGHFGVAEWLISIYDLTGKKEYEERQKFIYNMLKKAK